MTSKFLQEAAADLAQQLATFEAVTDVDDGYTPGKRQFDVQLNDTGRALGLTAADLAQQLRNAFWC